MRETILAVVVSVVVWAVAFPIVLTHFGPKTNTQRLERLIVVEKIRSEQVTLTAYSPRQVETDHDPRVTATLTKPIPGKTCAISRDLARQGWLGHKIWIEGYGVWVANDVMAPGWKKRIDLCLGINMAKKFGKKRAWAVVIE